MMICRFMFLLCLLVFSTGCRDAHRERDIVQFANGNMAYKQGDYPKAIKLYEDILASGLSSEPVYYNLGNALMKAGQLGRAIASYERALRLAPRDSDLKANLEFARGRIPNPEPDSKKFTVFVHLKEVTIDEIALIVTALAVALSGLFLAGLLLHWQFRKTTVILVALAGLLVFHVFALVAKIDEVKGAAVVISTVDVKYEPEVGATTHFSASEGWKVRVLKESSGWSKIERPDGLAGWVPSGTIEKI
jgi:hypothetical protein